MVRAVVFDIGGVLEFTPPTGWQERWCRELGLARDEFRTRLAEPARAGSLGTIDLEAFTTTVRRVLGLDDQQSVAFMEDIWHEYLGTPNTELIDYFTLLRGRVRTGILSNSFVGAREREQERYGFAHRCHAVVYSHEEGVMKPDPASYAIVCDRLDVRPHEVVFLDDVEENVAGARGLGMTAVLYRGNQQAIREIEANLRVAGPGPSPRT